MQQKGVKKLWEFVKEFFSKIGDKDLFSKSASLSYYTVFAIPPIILIVSFVSQQLLGNGNFQIQIFDALADVVGSSGAEQIQLTTANMIGNNIGVFGKITSVIALLLTSTAVFVTLQNHLNDINNVVAKPKLGWLKMIKDRTISFALVISLGFTFLASFLIMAFIKLFDNWLQARLGQFATGLIDVLTFLFSFLLIAILFTSIFQFLPDVKSRLKDSIVGGSITALLFILGKSLVGFYIAQSSSASIYEATGAILIIFIWTYYLSFIFLVGAVINNLYTKYYGGGIYAEDYAQRVMITQKPLTND